MSVKRLLCPDRIRKIEGSFSWIDHRFVTGGFLHDLSMIEILLCFYHDDRIASVLKIDLPALGKAREGLVRRSLLAYEFPLYQILSLPPRPMALASKEERAKQEQQIAHHYFKKIREMLQ